MPYSSTLDALLDVLSQHSAVSLHPKTFGYAPPSALMHTSSQPPSGAPGPSQARDQHRYTLSLRALRLLRGLLNSYHHLVLLFARFFAGQESEFDVVEPVTKSTASRRHTAQSHWTTPRLDHLVLPHPQAVTAHIADHRDHPVTLKARVGHPTGHSIPLST
ncbi:hypothetical protein JAAARDRAFT_211434 [Jaapia argillacea MUCL 33604]|uniref:Uncharacterized protein n=1 Tax=Jaapia argillacea MUCL 33604 TaxID=933084 RepID=A0A067P7V1_9AGAM|nr:hypothetical protein JAAARDRAFT_211434 [Jaapia argillacea MUCL 33604]